VRASIDAMARGLAEWDAAVARVEAGFKGAIGSAAPTEAARMRATLAATYLERGRALEALTHLDRAVALEPAFVPAHLMRGFGRVKLNQGAAAATAFAAARRTEPGAPLPAYQYLRATRGAATAPDRGAAIDALLEAAIGAPSTPTDLAGLPLNLLDDASVDAPLFVPAAYVPGFRLLADAKYPEALVALRAAAGAPSDAAGEMASLSKADALVASGDRAAALAILRDTARRLPLSGQAQWRLGRLSEDAGDQVAALRAYEAAASAAPVAGASIVLAAIGRLHHTALNLDAAARAYERRVALTPQSAPAHLDLAAIYQAQDRLDDALAESLAAVLVNPSSAAAFQSAGQLRGDQGDDEGAIALLRAAVRLDANLGAARYALGRALLREGRTEESRQEMAAFERIQKAEMDAQRRQFEENARKLEGAGK
jgi:tetratricopeptide (TPR) repeat protein